MTKTCWRVFPFTVPTAVHLKNANAEVSQDRRCSDGVKNVYISVRKIYSEQYVATVIRINWVL